MKISRLLIIGVALTVLAGCSSYDEKVDLTAEQREALQAEIIAQEEAIANFDPEEADRVYPDLEVISLARAYQQLGKNGKAIQIYEDFIDEDHNARNLLNNLGKLYEKVGETEKAVEYYQLIMDTYYEPQYLYDITWAYIRGGDRKMAEKYFNAWQLEFHTTDDQTQQAIKRLREKEKEEAGA